MQATVADTVVFEGVGVHSGARAVATVCPAPVDFGVVFERVDVTDKVNRIAARYDNVADTRLCTVIANAAGVSVGTIEHLMAALAGVGVSNALIKIDGPETPIMDGSSAPFVRGLTEVGLRRQDADRYGWRIEKRVEVLDGGRSAALSPSACFDMSFEIDFDAAAIGKQARKQRLVNGAFVSKLARARTFGMASDVEKLRAMGLARGGSLENAIVVDGDKILNRDGLRYSDEFVRHKMLDAVGDLALAGAPIVGRYDGVCAGHQMTNLLLRKLFDTPGAATRVRLDPTTSLGVGFERQAAA